MADMTKFVDLANKLIEKNGRQVTLFNIDATVEDPARPWLGSGGAVVTPGTVVKAVFVPAAGSKFGEDFMDVELMKDATHVALIAGGQGDFSLTNLIRESDNTDWKVDTISALQPAEQVVLYMIAVSR